VENRVGLVLSFPPAADDELGRDELATALYAGLPVVLWCRDARRSELAGEMRSLLDRAGSAELPVIAHRIRRDASRRGGDGSELAFHLSVLWDDFDRKPEPYLPLKAPQ
jgi:hypothetical protein